MPVPPSGGVSGHLAADRPQDPKLDLVDREAVAGGEPEPDRRARRERGRASQAA